MAARPCHLRRVEDSWRDADLRQRRLTGTGSPARPRWQPRHRRTSATDRGERSEKPRFQGAIDDVRIYGAVLTPEQVAVVATGASLTEIAAIEPERRTTAQADKLRLAFLDQYASVAIRDAWREVRALEQKRTELWNSFPTVMVMEEMKPRRETFRLIRGAYDNPGDLVSPGVPGGAPAAARGRPGEPSGVCALARRPGSSADRARDDQPFLADVLWDRPGEDGRELRDARGISQPSRAARLAGDVVRRLRNGTSRRYSAGS